MKARSLFAFAFVLVLALVVFLGYKAYLYATDSPYRISSQEAKRRINSGEVDVVLDVRTKLERDMLGVYPGSIPIPSADLEAEMPTRVPNKNARILAYCNTGHRARMATDKLHALGYKNAVYMSSTYKSIM